MKRFKMILTVPLAIIVMSFELASGQDLRDTDFDINLKSVDKARNISRFSTLVPIFAGIAWVAFDKPKREIETTYGGQTIPTSPGEDRDYMVSVSIMLTGLVVGPSTGYIYGGCYKRGITGLLLRAGTGALMIYWANSISVPESSEGLLSGVGEGLGIAAIYALGTIVLMSEAAYDIGKVDNSVKKRNSKILNKISNVTLAPAYFADSNAGGLEMNITF